MIYMVRKYIDSLPDGDYGVDDSYELVGIYDNIDTALEVKATVEAEIKKEIKDYPKMSSFVNNKVDIIPIELNKTTVNPKERLFLGGGSYIE